MRYHFLSSPLHAALLATPVLLTSTAGAEPAEASADASAQANLSSLVLSTPSDDPLAPRGNLWEMGIFGGLLWVSDRNALHDPQKPFANYSNPSPEVGLRLAYFPLSFVGIEGEIMAAASELDGGEGATTWAGRGHVLLQVPTSIVVPFALVGGGRFGVFSDLVGNDGDPAVHFGGGLKVNLHRNVSLRFDARDTITKQRPESDTAHHIEALASLGLVFGRPTPKPRDSDGDGVIDLQDHCPLEPGDPPDGCPIRDSDSDGILDPVDQCPNEAGVEPTGCPIRDKDGDGVLDATDECLDIPGIQPTGCPDKDGDGILDRDDKCLEVVGVAPDGCPPDSDGDGFIDSEDRCPNEPENKNGFEDDDGCPDTIPDVVKKFTGVIAGIQFATNKSEIQASSQPLLDEAAGVLNKYPTLKVMIVGHTDDRGKRDHNTDLSRRRADAVKAYLIDRGVDSERVLTRGEGPDQPIADNATRAGRAKNRRIEFTIIK